MLLDLFDLLPLHILPVDGDSPTAAGPEWSRSSECWESTALDTSFVG